MHVDSEHTTVVLSESLHAQTRTSIPNLDLRIARPTENGVRVQHGNSFDPVGVTSKSGFHRKGFGTQHRNRGISRTTHDGLAVSRDVNVIDGFCMTNNWGDNDALCERIDYLNLATQVGDDKKRSSGNEANCGAPMRSSAQIEHRGELVVRHLNLKHEYLIIPTINGTANEYLLLWLARKSKQGMSCAHVHSRDVARDLSRRLDNSSGDIEQGGCALAVARQRVARITRSLAAQKTNFANQQM